MNFCKLYYLWTVELKQPEESFWHKTLRQIFILVGEHSKFHAASDPSETEVFIDQI